MRMIDDQIYAAMLRVIEAAKASAVARNEMRRELEDSYDGFRSRNYLMEFYAKCAAADLKADAALSELDELEKAASKVEP